MLRDPSDVTADCDAALPCTLQNVHVTGISILPELALNLEREVIEVRHHSNFYLQNDLLLIYEKSKCTLICFIIVCIILIYLILSKLSENRGATSHTINFFQPNIWCITGLD